MTIIWLIMLALWALLGGFTSVPLVAWLLLVPFFIQDIYDGGRRRK